MEIAMKTIEVAGEGGVMPAFVAAPLEGGPFPGVLVVQEAFGLNDHIRQVAQRIAREGYVVLSPDLYYREAKRVVGYGELPEAISLMNSLWDEKVVKDMAGAILALQKQSEVDGERIGVTGFCMGGRITFLTACLNPAVKAAVPFYGGGIAQAMMPSERTPKAPLEYAERLQAPMLLFFGEDDPFIPLEQVEAIKQRLASLKKDAETVVYSGAPHGFFCDERDSYRAEAAKDAWERMMRFFRRHLAS